MQDRSAIPLLQSRLSNVQLNPIVRHECAEALAAIGDLSSLPLLRSLINDQAKEVAETCQIAVAKLEWQQQNRSYFNASKYLSVDPAPPLQGKSVEELEEILLNSSLSLFERYRAMFALRENGSNEAVLALGKGFDDSSAVFRHEIAYIMGQMQNSLALQVLQLRLKDDKEHAMVRHEAAEAIGSIAEENCEPILKDFAKDKDQIVRESCDVALDLVEYWNNDEISTAIAQPEEKKQEKTKSEGKKTVNVQSLTEEIATVAFVRKPKYQ
jgi:deoxyhypusine monooxygenase